MKVKGTISINPETGTISIQLDNGHHATDLYPSGIKNWLEEGIDYMGRQKEKVSPFKIFYRHQNGYGFEREFECYATSTENAVTQFRKKYGYDNIRIMRTVEV